jgi:hypothetical protein
MGKLNENGRREQTIFLHSELDDFGLSPAEFRIFAHLHRRRNNMTGIAWPGIDSIANTCRIAKQTVCDAIKRLEEHRMITADRRTGAKTSYSIRPVSEWQPFPNLDSVKGAGCLNQGTATCPDQGTKGYPSKVIQERESLSDNYKRNLIRGPRRKRRSKIQPGGTAPLRLQAQGAVLE